MKHLASAMRKMLPPALLAEVIAHLDPVTPFVDFLRSYAPEAEGRTVERPTLHERAVADRDLRPWRYYRLDYDELRKALDRYADHYGPVPKESQ